VVPRSRPAERRRVAGMAGTSATVDAVAPGPPAGLARRFALPALLATGLHLAAALPFVWQPAPSPPPSVVEDVEIASVAEPAAPRAAEAATFAESVAAAPPEPVRATEPPPDAVEAGQPETLAAAAPPDTLAPPPPEPLQEARPPEPVEAARPPEPEPLEAAPPEEALAALPPPPPPAPPPPRPQAEPRRAAPRPAQSAPPAPRPAEAPSAPAAAAAPVPPAPAPRRPPPSYVGALLAALERHKTYPEAARWRRAEGVAILRFAMRRDGTVTAWRIERSTGHADLDEAVERMIRRASPLPSPPPELPGDPVELAVPVRFSLR
jgi:protein TonB